jgi:hypothetical protein
VVRFIGLLVEVGGGGFVDHGVVTILPKWDVGIGDKTIVGMTFFATLVSGDVNPGL